jgi:hypothetical protein
MVLQFFVWMVTLHVSANMAIFRCVRYFPFFFFFYYYYYYSRRNMIGCFCCMLFMQFIIFVCSCCVFFPVYFHVCVFGFFLVVLSCLAKLSTTPWYIIRRVVVILKPRPVHTDVYCRLCFHLHAALLYVGFHCLSLHVSAYMAIFRCVGFFIYFHMLKGFWFDAFFFTWSHTACFPFAFCCRQTHARTQHK